VRVAVTASGNADVEIWEAGRHAGLFKKAFERQIEIVAA